MYRLSRTFLLRANEYNNIHNYVRATPRQCFSEFVKAKEHTQENNAPEKHDDTEDNNNNTNKITVQTLHKIISNSEPPVERILDKELISKSNDSAAYSLQDLLKVFYADDAIKIGKTVSSQKAIQIMKFIAKSKTRPLKLLIALTEKIGEKPELLDLKNCSDVMYCLSIFSLKNKEILDKISNVVIKKESTFTSGILPASMLQSCGILKYRNCELINILLKEVLNPDNPKRIQGMLTGLITLSAVNFLPPLGIILLNELQKCSKTDFPSTKSYLDFVWACIILKQYPVDHISEVLSETFISQIKVSEDSFSYMDPIFMKLLNINAAASYLMVSYSGPKLNGVKCSSLPLKSRSHFLATVIDALSHIFPKSGYLSINVDTGAGFILDVECFMDSQGNPVPLKKKKDGIKIGVMLLTFNDFNLDQETESGLTAFKESLLTAKGYKLVKVNYSEFNTNFKLYEKVQYLQRKFEAVYTN